MEKSSRELIFPDVRPPFQLVPCNVDGENCIRNFAFEASEEETGWTGSQTQVVPLFCGNHSTSSLEGSLQVEGLRVHVNGESVEGHLPSMSFRPDTLVLWLQTHFNLNEVNFKFHAQTDIFSWGLFLAVTTHRRILSIDDHVYFSQAVDHSASSEQFPGAGAARQTSLRTGFLLPPLSSSNLWVCVYLFGSPTVLAFLNCSIS